MEMKDREYATPDLFQSANLGAVFTSVLWRRAGREEWDQAFAWLWPDVSDVRSNKSVHWPNLRYFVEWKRFIADIPHDQINQIRRSIKSRFNDLIWILAPARDRLWTYKADNRYEALPNSAKSGPHVLINPTYYDKPIFDPPIIRMEEEEGSDDLNPEILHEQLFGLDDDLYSSDGGQLSSDADLFSADDGGDRDEGDEGFDEMFLNDE